MQYQVGRENLPNPIARFVFERKETRRRILVAKVLLMMMMMRLVFM